MARRVFLSVLGAGFYDPCVYKIGDYASPKSRFIQQVTIDYLKVKEWSENDAVIILLTNFAKKVNWDKQPNDQRLNPKTEKQEDYITLEQVLRNESLPMPVTTVDIPNGKNEEEMWEIFQKLYDNIQVGDELYIDLTHSFRYIPMMMMVFSNYAKFLKGVKVKSVTYGNYEVFKNEQSKTGFIVDITSLSQLQDWTAGADEFLSSGKVDKLRNIYIPQLRKKNEDSGYKDRAVQEQIKLVDNLNSVVNDLITCRGKNIIEGNNLKKLQNGIQTVMNAEMPQPFKPLFEKIAESFETFSSSKDILNGIKAARWCFDHKLYQQCTTLLRETIDTYVCEKVGVDYQNLNMRNHVNKTYNKVNNERKGVIPPPEKDKLDPILLDQMKGLEFWKTIDMNTLEHLVDIRNDFNHCGMLDNSRKDAEKSIIKVLENHLEYFENYFDKENPS